ncbi:MAG: glutamate 5-kinase [Methanomethylophilus sp.]|jgi:glutamate 5-kinase
MRDRGRVVVKVGTSTLTNEFNRPDLRSFDRLALAVSDLSNRGFEVILVSSGAIASGTDSLGLEEVPKDLCMKQAAAAVGQCRNMFIYGKFLGDYGKKAAQILLNAEDIESEEKKENLTNTFNALLSMGIIPIVNENDSVSYTEIESEDRLFGDNDVLSAVVAVLCKADLLVILSDIDGLYDKDPRLYPEAKLIERVEDIASVEATASGAGSRRGRGGMITKLKAASMATAQGIDTVIMNGKKPERLVDVAEGRPAGTLFVGRKRAGKSAANG